MKAEEKIYKVLDELGIKYVVHYHEAVYSASDVEAAPGAKQPGLNVKNLVILDKKSGEHYLVVLEDNERMDFKEMRRVTGWSNKVTFAGDEDLMKYLGVLPGSCSLLGLVNDQDRHMTVVLGRTIASAGNEDLISFHPNVNTATVTITIGDMYKFLERMGNRLICQEAAR